MARTIDKQKTSAILSSAADVFLERGYERTSIDLVAQAAGVARRTVYNQFESKEALFSAVTEHVWGQFRLDEAIRVKGDPAERLTAIAKAIVAFWMDSKAIAFLRLVIAEGDRFPDLASTFFDSGKQPVFRMLVAELVHLRKQGALAFPDEELAAKQLIGLLNEPLMWPRLLRLDGPPSRKRRAAVISAAVSTFLAAYGRN